jgi:hypothetical protein
VSETAEENLLARQAMALAQRSAEPLIEALEDILKTTAGSQPLEPMGTPEQEEEGLLFPSFERGPSCGQSSCTAARLAGE